jgi:diketogulonate reductase-like aldo/keto reductase
MLKEFYTLANGNKIPKIGLGTWQMTDDEAEYACKQALELGYTNIDTANTYQNEGGVGRGLKYSPVPREKLFITTKIRAEYKSADSARACIEESLKLLDCDYIDLLLIHAPMPWDEICGRKPKPNHRYEKENVEVWHVMEEYYARGKVKSLGLSNFENDDILNIISHAEVLPQVNQVRCYIGHTPANAIEFAKEKGILIQAYSPNATGRLLSDERVSKMAQKYGVSISQLAIKYDLQLGTQPLPKTLNPQHMKENISLDFTISPQDMCQLTALGTVLKVREK